MIRSQTMDHSAPPGLITHSEGYQNQPYVRILEQPAFRCVRFRYECEIVGRAAGSIVGINSTSEKRTFPTIQVMNYQGPYAVVVSCVTKDGPPYRPHPHNLVVGKENCKRGVCTQIVSNPDMTCSFPRLGIQCVKKRDIEKSLKIREKYNLDPFGTGFSHPNSIDLNVVRLCFQVFLRDSENRYYPIPPVVSEPIYDKKAVFDLTIMKLSHYSAPVSGGTEVILLCNRVAKEDIQIWFYEDQGSGIIWESPADFQPSDVHKQVAISFRTPRYFNENVQQPLAVFIELRKPSENKRGEPRPFQYLPIERDPEGLARKKMKVKERIDLERYFQGDVLGSRSVAQERQVSIGIPRLSRQFTTKQNLKAKPPIVCGGKDDIFASDYSTVSELPPASVPVGALSTSSYVIPADLPNLATSPGADSHSFATLPLEPAPMHMLHQMMSLSESSNQEIFQAVVDDAVIEKFDSLDLDIDLNLAQNLSASLFDSTPSITVPKYQDSTG